jgi:antitoxin component YwqK of YwqJK toxin-antitoxin module
MKSQPQQSWDEMDPLSETSLRGGVVLTGGAGDYTVSEIVGVANRFTSQDHNSLFYQMLLLDDDSLQSFCRTDTKAAAMCKDEDFWKAKSYKRHGIYNQKDSQPYDVSWKRIYLEKPMLDKVYHPDNIKEYKKWHDNGQIKSQHFKKDGKFHGDQLEWYENGQEYYIYFKKDGQFHGHQPSWYDNGEKKSEHFLKDGNKYGDQLGWYENGQQTYKHFYKDGKKYGVQIEWFDNGQQKYKHFYKDGKKYGVQIGWYENGQQKYKHFYKDGGIQVR